MFVSTPFVIFTLTAVGRVVSETYKKGDKAVLSPGSVSDPITSIAWKHGADMAVEWYGEETTEYRNFKGRCELNTNTGALTITNLSLKDSGRYTAEINNRIMKTTEIKVITAVPKPTIKKQCNPEVTQCTLTCDASITADMGTVIYSWKTGDRQIPESSSNQLDITKNDTESVGKPISCQLENPVSSERSDDIMSPFTNESSAGVNTAALIVFIVFLIVLLIAAALGGLVCWHKRRSGNADKSWGLYCACFNRKNFLNPAERNRGTERATGPVTGVGYTPVPTQDRQPVSTGISNGAAIPANQEDPEPEPTGTNNGAEKPESTLNIENEIGPDQTPAEPTGTSSEAATCSESRTVKNLDQPEPEPKGTTNGAETSPESQEDLNQHQPEPEPTGTNKEAEMPNNTSESQNEAGSDQTPAEPTGTSSEAETSAGAPNAEEPPDHHHQQEDETTEE